MSAVQLTPGAVAVGVGVLVGGFLLWRASQVAGKVAGDVVDTAAGIVTGNNAMTQNQTDADGIKTTAYEGMGVLGTLGAAANSVSGGWFASAGSWIGSSAYDLFSADPFATNTTAKPVSAGGASGAW